MAQPDSAQSDPLSISGKEAFELKRQDRYNVSAEEWKGIRLLGTVEPAAGQINREGRIWQPVS
jgi:hypothetical protein